MQVKRTALILLAIVLFFIYGLIAVRNFLYPITFGVVLAYLVYPLARGRRDGETLYSNEQV